MMTDELQKTSRREAREGYVRFILKQTGLEDEDIEEFLTERQAFLENKSPLELIYSGRYEEAVKAAETLVDELKD